MNAYKPTETRIVVYKFLNMEGAADYNPVHMAQRTARNEKFNRLARKNYKFKLLLKNGPLDPTEWPDCNYLSYNLYHDKQGLAWLAGRMQFENAKTVDQIRRMVCTNTIQLECKGEDIFEGLARLEHSLVMWGSERTPGRKPKPVSSKIKRYINEIDSMDELIEDEATQPYDDDAQSSPPPSPTSAPSTSNSPKRLKPSSDLFDEEGKIDRTMVGQIARKVDEKGEEYNNYSFDRLRNYNQKTQQFEEPEVSLYEDIPNTRRWFPDFEFEPVIVKGKKYLKVVSQK